MTDAELIEAVATEVMGVLKSDQDKDLFWYEDGYCTNDLIKFNPITNANHWMMIIQRMRDTNHEVRLYIFPDKLICCHIQKIPLGKPREGSFFDKDIGRAVCLASLCAIRSGQDG